MEFSVGSVWVFGLQRFDVLVEMSFDPGDSVGFEDETAAERHVWIIFAAWISAIGGVLLPHDAGNTCQSGNPQHM